MSFFLNLLGTVSKHFYLGAGSDGVKLKNNSGVFEIKNLADDAFVKTRVATPVDTNDAATKEYCDGLTNGITKQMAVSFVYSDATTESTANIPANAVITGIIVNVTTGFDPDTITLKIGHSTTDDLLFATTDISDITAIEEYIKTSRIDWGDTARKLLITITGTATVGAGNVVVTFSVPLS
jgi:hypothetical protein